MWNQVALESITMNKGSGGDRIPVELFLILKDDAVKVLHSICQQIWKLWKQWPQDCKRSDFIPIPKKGNVKECSNYGTIALICDPMNHSTPGLHVHHQLLEFTQTHVHQVSDDIQPSHPVVPFSSCPQSLPASESFPMSQVFTWGGQNTGVSALASFLPKNLA